jgi:NADH dehydrogenase (ubiquinone) 1 alpha subcomplex subunit 5
VHPRPLPPLKWIYTETLTGLSVLPASSVYRQATEALTKHRMAILDRAGEDIAAAERELGTMVEVAIQEAEVEKKLVDNMGEWKA